MTDRTRPRRWSLPVALALHLFVLWPYTASGLVAPGWAVVLLLVVWALLAVVIVVVQRRYGPLALIVPPLALLLWFGVITLGETTLGWTA